MWLYRLAGRLGVREEGGGREVEGGRWREGECEGGRWREEGGGRRWREEGGGRESVKEGECEGWRV